MPVNEFVDGRVHAICSRRRYDWQVSFTFLNVISPENVLQEDFDQDQDAAAISRRTHHVIRQRC